jgi:hypothetical protein
MKKFSLMGLHRAKKLKIFNPIKALKIEIKKQNMFK